MVTTFENHHYDQIIEVDEDIAENRNDGEEDQSGRLAGSCHLLQGSGIATDQAEPIIITLVFPKVNGKTLPYYICHLDFGVV